MLLAGQPRRQVKFRHFTKRALGILSLIDPSQTDVRYARDRVRHLLNEMRDLGAIELIKNGRQTSHIKLRAGGARRLLLGDAVRVAIDRYRTTKTGGIRQLAESIEVTESTIWKWRREEHIPNSRYALKVSLLVADQELTPDTLAAVCGDLCEHYFKTFDLLDLTPAEASRAFKWLERNHLDQIEQSGLQILELQPDHEGITRVFRETQSALKLSEEFTNWIKASMLNNPDSEEMN